MEASESPAYGSPGRIEAADACAASRPEPSTGDVAPSRTRTGRLVLFGAVGGMMVACTILVVAGSWVFAAAAALFVAVLGYAVVFGKAPGDDPRRLAAARFLELADPTRPLAPEDFRSPHAQPAARDVDAEPHPRS